VILFVFLRKFHMKILKQNATIYVYNEVFESSVTTDQKDTYNDGDVCNDDNLFLILTAMTISEPQ